MAPRKPRKLRLSHAVVAIVASALGSHVYLHSADSLGEVSHLWLGHLGGDALPPLGKASQLVNARASFDAGPATNALIESAREQLNLAIDELSITSVGESQLQADVSQADAAVANAGQVYREVGRPPALTTTAARMPAAVPATLASRAVAAKPATAFPLTSRHGALPAPHAADTRAEASPINTQGLGTRRPYFIHFHKGQCSVRSWRVNMRR
jgi:hypothetical protein